MTTITVPSFYIDGADIQFPYPGRYFNYGPDSWSLSCPPDDDFKEYLSANSVFGQHMFVLFSFRFDEGGEKTKVLRALAAVTVEYFSDDIEQALENKDLLISGNIIAFCPEQNVSLNHGSNTEGDNAETNFALVRFEEESPPSYELIDICNTYVAVETQNYFGHCYSDSFGKDQTLFALQPFEGHPSEFQTYQNKYVSFAYVTAYFLYKNNAQLWLNLFFNEEGEPRNLHDQWVILSAALSNLFNSRRDSISSFTGAPLKPKSEDKPAKKASPPKKKKEDPEPTYDFDISTENKARLNAIPTAHREKLLYELKKLSRATGQEANNLLDWTDQVLSFPWGVTRAKEIDFSSLRSLMDSTHYGLNEVKDILTEHLVIEKITGRQTGGVLCFTGPAGTGKTSIAKSIATASNRLCFSLPLGGLTDEAEVRGHRRTYVSSKAGRIVSILQQAKCMDPLIILDEIDKTPMRGAYSPVTAAFLEILDPQQNSSFSDRYLELPIDLSKVLFICTANEEADIPPALKDRMEIIRFREYTKEERRIILTKYMIPNIFAEYNLLASPYDYDIKFADEAISMLIEEVQLRQIELNVRRLLKKAATSIYLHGVSKVLIDGSYLKEQALKLTPIRVPSRIGF